jgi:amidophosphoribosyltransferase
MVRDVFRTRNMRDLLGNLGIAHTRYPDRGSADSAHESQPFYVNSPFGIVLAHNGNLTNTEALREELSRLDFRHLNTNSDTEVLLNIFAYELERIVRDKPMGVDAIFEAVSGVHQRCRGAYAVVALIAGWGLLAFRDPYGIRPLIIGKAMQFGVDEYAITSESVALDTLGFETMRDVAPGEAIFVTQAGEMLREQCAPSARLFPCIFEFVYLARPDSVIDGASVYERGSTWATRSPRRSAECPRRRTSTS